MKFLSSYECDKNKRALVCNCVEVVKSRKQKSKNKSESVINQKRVSFLSDYKQQKT